MDLLSDNPITQKSDDEFVFESFVEILGAAILDTRYLPFTVGIFGEWGTGKTSLMHLLRNWLEGYLFSWDNVTGTDSESHLRSLWDDLDIAWVENAEITKPDYKIIRIFNKDLNKIIAEIKIDEKKKKAILKINDSKIYNLKVKKENGKLNIYLKNNKCKTIWFNPWKYDNKEELWSALIRSIILEIYKDPKTKWKLKKVAWRLLKDIAWFAFKGGISTATRGIISLGDLETMKETMAKESLREHDFLDKFESNFSQLVEDFVGEDGRLVVFIDDLDRCIPENAITILESLKLYLDNPHCVFVLGMDRAIVELGIKHRYGEDIQLSGREYLEKIVQLPFFLPPLHFKNLKQALQSQSKAANYPPQLWIMLEYGLGGNPRKVKRFVNSFYMAQEAFKRLEFGGRSGFASTDDNAEKIEDVPYDIQLFYLAEVLVIQMSYTDFYDYLLMNPWGWGLYEDLRKAPGVGATGSKESILKQDPDLAIVWQNRHLRLFMKGMSGEIFPPPPPLPILEKLLRFAAFFERREHADIANYKKKM
jgi:hypothetical protein